MASLTLLGGCSNAPVEAPAPPIDVRLDLRERLAYRRNPAKEAEAAPNREHVGGSPAKGQFEEPPPGSGLCRHMSPEQTERLLGKPTSVWGGENTRPGETYLIYHMYEKWGLQLTFHSHRGLGGIEITKRWPEPIVGARVGDHWDEFLKANNLGVYLPSNPLPAHPGWRVSGRINGRVSSIKYADEGIVGQWEVVPGG